MNRQQRRHAARPAPVPGFRSRPAPLPPPGGPPGQQAVIPPWSYADGKVTAQRAAEFWQPAAAGAIDCTLCYRRCHLAGGEAGWCNYRENRDGTMALRSHGVISCAAKQMQGYQVNLFRTYKPGATSLYLGGTNCTSACTFCMSKEIAWRPEKLPWRNGESGPGDDTGWYNQRAMLHPDGAVFLAQQWGCAQISFGINEPTLSWEYTYDVARLAQRAGLEATMDSNGFTTPAAVQRLAQVFAAVNLGVKGSGEPAFYAKWMRSPDAMPAVRAALLAWRRAGVHLFVSDLIAPPHLQDDAAFEQAAVALYTWIRRELGALTPLLIVKMGIPGLQPRGKQLRFNGSFLPATATERDFEHYLLREQWALELARAAGLPYAHLYGGDPLCCHACGGVLLQFPLTGLACEPCTMAKDFCVFRTHQQQVTDHRCDHCGTWVPIVTLSSAALAAERAKATALAPEAIALSTRYHVERSGGHERRTPLTEAELRARAGLGA